MIDRRHFLGAAALGGAAFASLSLSARRALPQTASSAASPGEVSMKDRLNEPGPEARFLARRVGLWDVTETAWPDPWRRPGREHGSRGGTANDRVVASGVSPSAQRHRSSGRQTNRSLMLQPSRWSLGLRGLRCAGSGRPHAGLELEPGRAQSD